MTVDIRPWQPGDEAAITQLFEAVFGRPMTADFWNWRYRNHPAGGPLVMLAWVGGRLASHYAASQCPMVVDGQTVPAALSMTSMTHPDFRKMGLFEKTGHALYEQLGAQGYACTWGFPNANVNVHRQRKLGWQPISDVATLSLRLAPGTQPGAEIDELVEVDAIDDRFGRHSNRMRQTGTISCDRGTATLAWRIDANPVNRYIRLILPAGAEIAGYALLKRWGMDEMDIVDVSAEDDVSLRALLRGSFAKAAQLGCSKINTWCLNRDERRLTMEYMGLNATGPVTYMGGCAFDSGFNGFDDPRRWRISMLDSDLY